MNFKYQQYEINNNNLNISQYSYITDKYNINIYSIQDILEKIKNSICLILEICDRYGLGRNTKYMGYWLFVRYSRMYGFKSDQQLSLVIQYCLHSAIKYNQTNNKQPIFNKSYFHILTYTINNQDIPKFQKILFKLNIINYQITIKSPYQYLDNMFYQKNKYLQIPINIYNVVNAYIDFALTLIQLLEYDSQEIYLGCLYAVKNSSVIQNIQVQELLQQECSIIKNSAKIGQVIIKIWKQIVEDELN